jgi:hypothetical protein
MSDQLVLLDEARARLAKVASVDEAKFIRDRAAAMEHYARQQRGALDAANKASEIKVRAERRIGELLKAVPRETPKAVAARGGMAKAAKAAGPHRGGKHEAAEVVVQKAPLREAIERAAITPRMAEDCQKLAAIPAPMFEAAIATMQTDPEVAHRGVSTAGMLRVYRESDGSPESIVRAVKKQVAADPAVRFGAAFSKLVRAVAEVEEMAQESAFVEWLCASTNNVQTLRAAIKGLRAIEKGVA